MERFGRDVLAILDDLNIGKVHWCGLSMGGMVGQWLGANAPERLGKIILSNTACYYPDPTNWRNRIKAVKEGGIAAVADTVIASWLSADFREREPQIAAKMKAMLIASPVQGYLACCEALSTLDQRELLPRIKSPTLVIAGRHDTATADRGRRIDPQPDSRREHDDSRRRTYFQCRAAARFHRCRDRLPGATLTQTSLRANGSAQSAARWLLAMTRRDLWTIKKRRDEGMAQRRKVLGDVWVDRSIANKNSFNAEFIDLITRHAWGEIWTRPHFDQRIRRVLVIGTMVALVNGMNSAFTWRAALTEGGFTPDDIKEILLQQAVYCGVPAANHAVKEHQRLFRS